MYCINTSYRFQVPFPEHQSEADLPLRDHPVEHRILTGYLHSVLLRLKLITQLKLQGKLPVQQAEAEICLLRSQLHQTQRELGLSCSCYFKGE